jgi:plastocyanin
MSTGFRKHRRGFLAATSTLAVAAGIAVVSVAGAAQETKIYVSDVDGTTCFTARPDQTSCGAGGPVDVTVQTGDKVTWDFAGATMAHNVAADAKSPSDEPNEAWKAFITPGKPPIRNPGDNGTDSFVFGKAGVYRYVCQLHATMKGTITVVGEEVATPTPTPTVSATPTPTFAATAIATATPDDHTSTPRPGHASATDTQPPSLQRASVKRVAAGAQLRFTLSEPATVSIALVRKGAKSSAASAVVHAPAGTRSFVLRTKALKRGTYSATFAPVDAMGNKGATATKTLRVR